MQASSPRKRVTSRKGVAMEFEERECGRISETPQPRTTFPFRSAAAWILGALVVFAVTLYPTNIAISGRRTTYRKEPTIPQRAIVPEAATDLSPYIHWPPTLASLTDDMVEMEVVATTISVPRFWSLPFKNQSQVLQVGSCTSSRPEDCPREKRTIFVLLTPYRNPKACQTTLESLLEYARHPERIRVGIVDQRGQDDDPCMLECEEVPNSSGLCQHKDRIHTFELDADLASGPTLSSHLGHRLYRGEYYALELEADRYPGGGIDMIHHWDSDLIQQWERTGNEMAVLSHYLHREILRTQGKRAATCGIQFNGDDSTYAYHLQLTSQPLIPLSEYPTLQPFLGRPFVFARGHFVVNVPSMVFPLLYQGDEILRAVRAFTWGYDFYTPQHNLAYYRENIFRQRPWPATFWENQGRYPENTQRLSQKRAMEIIQLDPSAKHLMDSKVDEYALGTVRTPDLFYQSLGIDRQHGTVPRLCRQFGVNTTTMHQQLSPFLAPNGMGIDYNTVHPSWYMSKGPVWAYWRANPVKRQ